MAGKDGRKGSEEGGSRAETRPSAKLSAFSAPFLPSFLPFRSSSIQDTHGTYPGLAPFHPLKFCPSVCDRDPEAASKGSIIGADCNRPWKPIPRRWMLKLHSPRWNPKGIPSRDELFNVTQEMTQVKIHPRRSFKRYKKTGCNLY